MFPKPNSELSVTHFIAWNGRIAQCMTRHGMVLWQKLIHGPGSFPLHIRQKRNLLFIQNFQIGQFKISIKHCHVWAIELLKMWHWCMRLACLGLFYEVKHWRAMRTQHRSEDRAKVILQRKAYFSNSNWLIKILLHGKAIVKITVIIDTPLAYLIPHIVTLIWFQIVNYVRCFMCRISLKKNQKIISQKHSVIASSHLKNPWFVPNQRKQN